MQQHPNHKLGSEIQIDVKKILAITANAAPKVFLLSHFRSHGMTEASENVIGIECHTEYHTIQCFLQMCTALYFTSGKLPQICTTYY